MLRCAGVLTLLLLPASLHAQEKFKISWKKTTLDKVFRSEGAAIADVNKDGKMDVLVGDAWFAAPDWKMHTIRTDKPFNPSGYSECFGVFSDDFNKDGWPDMLVVPFPGKACYWYENPQNKSDKWPQHQVTHSCCNETPIYVDLLKTGRRVLLCGWKPQEKGSGAEVCYFTPGSDPTKPWERYSVTGKSPNGKDFPGGFHFYHGLGHGDINGDGRNDVLVPDGWWEQPAKLDGQAWIWHPTKIGPACADMHVADLDGDGKADIISSSAHGYGLWWHQQKPGKDGPTFVTQEIHPLPAAFAKVPADLKLSKDEEIILSNIQAIRGKQYRSPWRPSTKLFEQARAIVEKLKRKETVSNQGKAIFLEFGQATDLASISAFLNSDKNTLTRPGQEVGVAVHKTENDGYHFAVLVEDRSHFTLPGQTHALHHIDINGDGLKDLVTGRRYWAHGPKGDVTPADPASVVWFEAKKDANGIVTYVPHEIDDDSGIATQFTVADINGDGLLDIIVSNKHGIYVIEQVRTPNRKD